MNWLITSSIVVASFIFGITLLSDAYNINDDAYYCEVGEISIVGENGRWACLNYSGAFCYINGSNCNLGGGGGGGNFSLNFSGDTGAGLILNNEVLGIRGSPSIETEASGNDLIIRFNGSLQGDGGNSTLEIWTVVDNGTFVKLGTKLGNTTFEIWEVINNGTFSTFSGLFTDLDFTGTTGFDDFVDDSNNTDTNTYNTSDEMFSAVNNGSFQYNISFFSCPAGEVLAGWNAGFNCTAVSAGSTFPYYFNLVDFTNSSGLIGLNYTTLNRTINTSIDFKVNDAFLTPILDPFYLINGSDITVPIINTTSVGQMQSNITFNGTCTIIQGATSIWEIC